MTLVQIDTVALQIAFERWFEKCDELYQDNGRGPKLGYHLEYEFGRKYIKIINCTGNQRSVWAFVEMKTGNIYKPANWKRPAKHTRGNIFDKDGGMKYMQWTGPMYMTAINEINKEKEADYNNPKWYES